jgi:hypothetical protein
MKIHQSSSHCHTCPRILKYQTIESQHTSHSPFLSTYLPLLEPRIPICHPWRRPARHLGLMCLDIGLRKSRTLLLVRLVMRLLAVLVAVGDAVAFIALSQRLCLFIALCA